MNLKKLNAYIAKELHHIGKNLKREKARCARLYPDWRDDEFNMLDNKFIWGYNTDPKITPSFYSWDDAYIYYNRANKKYYMTVDIGYYGVEYSDLHARGVLYRLWKIKKAFGNFVEENGLQIKPVFPFNDPALEADSIGELYFKFCIMCEGYKQYF